MHVAKNTLPTPVIAHLEQHDLTVITEPGHLQMYAAGTKVIEIPSIRDVTAAAAALRTVLCKGPVDRLLHPFELGQSVAGYLRSLYGIPGMGFQTANVFTNKFAMKEAYKKAGLPSAPAHITYSPEGIGAAAQTLGWPVIVKPMLGGGSMDVHRLDGPESLRELLTAPEYESFRALTVPLVVEPFVEVLAEFHCDGIVIDGAIVFAEASEYLAPLLDCPPEFNGSFFLAAGDPLRASILTLHREAVRALDLRDGVTHMEFFRTPGGILAGEIACRPAGGAIPEAIEHAYGVDIWDAQLRIMLGEDPSVHPIRTEGCLVNYHLPVSPGRITGLTAVEDLQCIDNVVAARITKKVGDVIPPNYNSSYASGVVFVHVDDRSGVDDAVRRLADAFSIEVEPLSSTAKP
ncbi:Biotin carboxylase [Plantibacter flavus]|uniref:Biotin carboxylase n=1 Tax=Plantibacter flavus TaxID=150123 RepID=A0A3N2C7K7_9MICO|nr:biotin carboxylase [Plantibacter flavus]SMG24121.1 Biotin carboxylase [Plantibacter flavus]